MSDFDDHDDDDFDDDCDYDRRDWWIDTVLAYFTFALIAFFFGYLYWQMFVRF